MSRIVLLILFQWTIIACDFGQTTDPSRDQVASWRSRINSNNEDLLQTLVELQKQTAMVEQLIPELTKLLNEGNEPARLLTVRCLNQAGVKAGPAVAGLVSDLDHRDYLFRAEVMQTLKAIGPSAVPELKGALKSPSPRIRAAALSTLNSLVTVEADLLEQLQNDPDSRVRIGVAQAWKKHGKRGVENIVSLLKDPESVVATGAAYSLRFHFEDPQMAVKHLSESLSEFKQRYELAMSDQTDDGGRGRTTILNVLTELGPDADSFMDEIARLIQFASSHRISDQYTLQHGLTLLAVVGSPRSIELLKTFQFDRDWQIQSKVKRILGMIDEGMEINYGTYIR